MAYFVCNMVETHFLSTGAFEISLNGESGLKRTSLIMVDGVRVLNMFFSLSDVPLWSKLQSGYVPNIQEILKILHSQLKINQVDQMSFS